jgi:hypothetical protein
MICSLAWMLPWGVVIAFFLWKSGLRPVWTWLIVLSLVLTLGRGDPGNLLSGLSSRSDRNRPSPEDVDAFRFLGSEPAPQGVVLAPDLAGRMTAAFVSDAYPAIYRGTGSIGKERRKELFGTRTLKEPDLTDIAGARISYILIEKHRSLSKAMGERRYLFSLVHENDTYQIWKVSSAVHRRAPTSKD